MLWIARDRHGLFLFRGPNPPDWDEGLSQTRKDGTCDFIDEISEVEVPGLVLAVGQSTRVELVQLKETPS